MIKSLFAAMIGLAAFHSTANAQIIYEPVKFQYGPELYYGGSDARVLDHAAQLQSVYGQPRKYDFKGHELTTLRRGITTRTAMVFSDAAPGLELSLYGYTSTDAQNEANASVPRYFRKRDLLRAARLDSDGTYVVPAQAKPIPAPIVIIKREATTKPTTKPAAILILPRKKAAKPATPVSDNQPVAMK